MKLMLLFVLIAANVRVGVLSRSAMKTTLQKAFSDIAFKLSLA